MRTRHYLLLAAGLVLTGLGYLPGLWGPFWLDDYQNLAPLNLWRDGALLWQGVVFGNESGPLGRPLSMATFLFNAATTGLGPWGFKATNLLIHLACGILIAGFVNRLARLDPRLHAHAPWIALLLAAWWLLLPVHTATVFYVVQRMAQLSALFLFAGLWTYLAARNRLESGKVSGVWLLFAGVPALTIAGALAKENALLLPVLCLAVEVGMYRGMRRPVAVKWFLRLFVLLPTLAALAVLVVDPGFFLGGYAGRPFTLIERLLTESRVLWGYVQKVLVPFGTGLSVFQDDVTLSRSLLQPVTTLISILGWIGALVLAWLARRSAPLILTGLLLFLGGHLMESTIFPLELAFLHRNYMPSLGLLVAVVGVVGLLSARLPATTLEFRRIAAGLLLTFLAVLWGATHARAWIWQSEASLVAAELKHNPDSVRGRTAAAQLAIRAGDPKRAMHEIEEAEKRLDERELGTASIWRIMVYCGANRSIPPELVEEFRSRADDEITAFERGAFDELTSHLENARCPIENLDRIANAARIWVSRSGQSPHNEDLWRFRYDTARLLARSGNLEGAFPMARQAFAESQHEFPIGVFAFQLATSLGKPEEAELILERLEGVAEHWDLRQQRAIEQFRAFLNESTSKTSDRGHAWLGTKTGPCPGISA